MISRSSAKRVVPGGGDGRSELPGAHEGVGYDPGACADRQGILAGQRGAHAAVGREMGETLVADLEQKPGGDVVGVSRKRVCAEPCVAGEGHARRMKIGKKRGESADELGVPARLILAPGAADVAGKGRQIGGLGWFGRGAGHLRGEHERQRPCVG